VVFVQRRISLPLRMLPHSDALRTIFEIVYQKSRNGLHLQQVDLQVAHAFPSPAMAGTMLLRTTSSERLGAASPSRLTRSPIPLVRRGDPDQSFRAKAKCSNSSRTAANSGSFEARQSSIWVG
jgi:hypothetical protein